MLRRIIGIFKTTLEILAGFVIWLILMTILAAALIPVAVIAVLGRLILLVIHRTVMMVILRRRQAA